MNVIAVNSSSNNPGNIPVVRRSGQSILVLKLDTLISVIAVFNVCFLGGGEVCGGRTERDSLFVIVFGIVFLNAIYEIEGHDGIRNVMV